MYGGAVDWRPGLRRRSKENQQNDHSSPTLELRIIDQQKIMGQEKARLMLSTKLLTTKQVGGKLPG